MREKKISQANYSSGWWLQVMRELEHHLAVPGRDTSNGPFPWLSLGGFIFPNDEPPFEK